MKCLPISSMLNYFVFLFLTALAPLADSRSDVNNLFSQDELPETSIFDDLDGLYATVEQGIFENPNFTFDDFSTTDDPSSPSSSSELLTSSFSDLSTANLFDYSNPDLDPADSSDLLMAGGIVSPQ